MNSTNERSNPYFLLQIEGAVDQFYGSATWVRRICETISAPTPRSIELLGLPGMGKSSLLHYLAHPEGALAPDSRFHHYLQLPYREKPQALVMLRVEFRLCPADQHPFVYLLQQIRQPLLRHLRQLAKEQPVGSSDAGADDFVEPQEHEVVMMLRDAYTQFRHKALEQLRMSPRIVLLLDDFDLAFERLTYDETTYLRPLREFVSFILVTERPLHVVNDQAAGSPFFQTLPIVHMGGLSQAEAWQLASEPAHQAGYPLPEEDIEAVLTFTSTHVFLIIQACRVLWDLREELGLIADARALQANERELLRGRLAADSYRTFFVYWEALSLQEHEVLLLLVREEQKNLTHRQHTLLAALIEKGLVRYRSGNGYALFSELFKEFMLDVQDSQESAKTSHGLYSHARPASVPENPNRKAGMLQEARGRAFVPAALDTKLTELEASLVAYLRSHSGKVGTFKELQHNVWHAAEQDDENVRRRMQVTISRLRPKLQQHGEDIVSVRGKGYRLVVMQVK